MKRRGGHGPISASPSNRVYYRLGYFNLPEWIMGHTLGGVLPGPIPVENAAMTTFSETQSDRPSGAVPAGSGPLQPANLLGQMTAGLSQGQDIGHLLGQFLDPLVRMVEAQAGLVRLLSDDGLHFKMVADIGMPEEWRACEKWVDHDCGACGHAASSQNPVWSDNLTSCHVRSGLLVQERNSFCAMLAVPMRYREQILGMYNLFFSTPPKTGPEINGMLRSVGELLGLALHSARLEREHLRTTLMDERKLLANEVHDGMAQTLVYAHMRIPLLQDAIVQKHEALATKYCSDVEQALTSMHGNLRDIMANFRTPLAPKGLLPGLQDICHTFRVRTGITVHLDCGDSDPGLSVEQELQVFHIVQEALSNVYRHAMSQEAWLQVQHTAHALDVFVRDAGTGLDGAADGNGRPGHYGLGIMHERAQRLGGQLRIERAAVGGTQVSLHLPLHAAVEGSAV